MRFLTVAAATTLLAASTQANLHFFLTQETVSGNLGTSANFPMLPAALTAADPLRARGPAGFDALCRMSAKNRGATAKYASTFVSVLSTGVTASTLGAKFLNRVAFNAADRVLNLPGDFPVLSEFSGKTVFHNYTTMFSDGIDTATIEPIQSEFDYFNANMVSQPFHWTGSNVIGTSFNAVDCNGWTAQTTGVQGNNGAPTLTPQQWLNNGANDCNAQFGVYCVEQNQVSCLFVSKNAYTPLEAAVNFGSMDGWCNFEATKDAMATDYKALVVNGGAGTPTHAIYNQFPGTEGSYLFSNLVNTVVGTLRSDLVFQGTFPGTTISTINGIAPAGVPVWTGVSGKYNDINTATATQNCNNWTSGASTDSGFVGNAGATSATFVDGSLSCDQQAHVYCLRQTVLLSAQGQTCSSFVQGDPHFRGFDGSKYNFNGQDGEIFAIVSDAGFQLNAEFTAMKVGSVDGTWMTKVGVRVGRNLVVVNPMFSGVLVNGELTESFDDGDLVVSKYDGAYVIESEASGYAATVKQVNFVDEHLVSKSYVDVQFAMFKKPVHPHGLLGQTARFMADGKAPAPVVSSGMNGEGVVEGMWSDYIVHDGLTGIDFNFASFGSESAPQKAARAVVEPLHAGFAL